MKLQRLYCLLLIATLASPFIGFTQPPPPPPPPKDTNQDVPLDGGLSILLAAGAGYGIKKSGTNAGKNRQNDGAYTARIHCDYQRMSY